MGERLVVVGAGGFGREALDVAEAMNAAATDVRWDIVGVVDDAPSDENLERLRVRGVPYLGTIAQLPDDVIAVIGVGSPTVRRTLDESLSQRGYEFATLVHPSAVLGSQVSVAPGTVICAGASVGTNVRLGRHVHLNPHTVVGHDTTLGDHISVNPNATISGDCVIGNRVLIGVAGVILNGITVGDDSTLGGSACVVRDVPPCVVVKGIPAK